MNSWLPAILVSVSTLATACATERPPADATGPVTLNGSSIEVPAADEARVVLAASDRTPDDRALDAPRQALDVLAYLDVRQGANVAVLAPGSGYFLELVARSVGPEGRLFARNPPSLLAKNASLGVGSAWDARLATPAGSRVVRVDSELSDPLPQTGLDLVYLAYDYRDLGAAGIDAAAIDAVAWGALRSGGRFVVVDRADAHGAGHERRDIEGRGFRFVSEGRFLHSGVTPTDWGPPLEGAQVLRTFVKP